ncbi:peptidoglycan-binding protein [Roseateles toxinivorans]|uniref:Glycosyl hydrolase family 46 n=1 Tax=Roseateles toxinivorans TaxID=270368 RepID=A0A4R6QLW6_9BURK|nr:peptidoglycan-binding protein [Roseateles toxinivorans]TDP64232.1 glycosyl hydrolase family 46 [Roseateles toxinivorans]
MGRVYFAKGLKGMIARRIQTDLLRQGIFAGAAEKFVDGDFGGNTTAALQALQQRRSLPVTGSVDEATWSQLTPDPLPSLYERCLGLTAAFEGHGFGLVQGNFDGAGLTWGVIGFTLSNGEIQAITKEAEALAPGVLARTFQDLAPVWLGVCAKPLKEQIAWADSISSGPTKERVPDAWLKAFARLGDEPIIKRIQMQRAFDKYFVPAAASARRLGLTSELGVALAFDVHVQNGGFKPKAFALAAGLQADTPEAQRRLLLANAVADSALPRWQENVRRRKTTIAQGTGLANGANYTLASWGLAEVPAA